MLVSGRVDTLYFGLSRYIKYQKYSEKKYRIGTKRKRVFIL